MTRWVSRGRQGQRPPCSPAPQGHEGAKGGGSNRERGVCRSAPPLPGKTLLGYWGPLALRCVEVQHVAGLASRLPSDRPPRRPRPPRQRSRGRQGCADAARERSETRPPGKPGAEITSSSEQTIPSAPSMEGFPWSMPRALRPQSATAQPSETEMTVATTVSAWANGDQVSRRPCPSARTSQPEFR